MKVFEKKNKSPKLFFGKITIIKYPKINQINKKNNKKKINKII